MAANLAPGGGSRYLGIMLSALLKAFAQLPEPRVRGTVLLSILGSVAISLALAGLAGWLLVRTRFFGIPWLEWSIDVLGGAATLVLVWVLFPAVVGLVAGLLLERVCRAVEAVHYPHLPAPRDQPLAEAIGTALRFGAVLVVLNLLALPLYLVLLFIPGAGLVLFYLLNGYLLGREFFEMVAVRRMDAAAARKMRLRHRRRVFVAGLAIAFLGTIPLVNLILPIVASAFMMHQFEAMRARPNRL